MISLTKNRIKIVCILFCGFLAFLTSAGAKPTLPFSLPASFRSLTGGNNYATTESTSAFGSIPASVSQFIAQKQARSMKSYSGSKRSKNSLVMIYHHDLTIAIVELGPKKWLINCEIIEIYDEQEGKKLLQKLSAINRPLEIGFQDMMKLMSQCQIIDTQYTNEQRSNDSGDDTSEKPLFQKSPISLFSGIIPGTKWCGTGDIARTYSDLGEDKAVDRCCRTHDLCPTKIRAYQSRYELSNNSIYTKSHCNCDDLLFSCLKKSNSTSGHLLGNIYFNLVQVPCLAGSSVGQYSFRHAREGF